HSQQQQQRPVSQQSRDESMSVPASPGPGTGRPNTPRTTMSRVLDALAALKGVRVLLLVTGRCDWNQPLKRWLLHYGRLLLFCVACSLSIEACGRWLLLLAALLCS